MSTRTTHPTTGAFTSQLTRRAALVKPTPDQVAALTASYARGKAIRQHKPVRVPHPTLVTRRGNAAALEQLFAQLVQGNAQLRAPLRFLQEIGFTEVHTGNETTFASTDPGGDPSKVRFSGVAGGLGALSWNRFRNPTRGDWVQLEMVLVQGKQDERTRYLPYSDPRTLWPEVTVHFNIGGQDDRHMRLIWMVRHDVMWTAFTGWLPSILPNQVGRRASATNGLMLAADQEYQRTMQAAQNVYLTRKKAA